MRGRIFTGLSVGVGLILVAAASAAALGLATSEPSGEPAASTAVGAEVVSVDKWFLYQSNGRELYEGLCASCHGVEGAGNGKAALVQAVYPPALDRLASSGVDRDHWAYVVRAHCEDGHHWAPGGVATMPCWQRIFRQALGSDAGATLVSAKLVDYLEDIQR